MISKLKIRSKKYLAAAKEQSCVRCGISNGTIVGAHYSGIRCHLYGKGTGTKCHDICVADLCSECHNYFDNPNLGLRHSTELNRRWRKTEMSEDFLHCVMLTLIRRCEQGVLYTDDMSLGK